jgi:hypothetical protein
MNSPNLQQRLYLAKALNENTDTLFDHPEMNEARRRGVPFSKTEAQLRRENMAAGKAWLAKKGKKAPLDKNAEKKQEETNEESISEGVKRMRRLRRAHVSGKASRETADAYDKELSKLSASRLRRGGARKQTIRGFFTDKPTTPAADKAYERFSKGAMDKANAKGKKIFEDVDLDEGSYVHSKGELKKAIKGSKREIVKAVKKGDKEEAKFWMQNKKDAEEQLKEATRSKYLKVYGKHKVGSDESKALNLARLKREVAMLQRGGADAETMKKAAAAQGRFNRNEPRDPTYNPHDASMATYRFARKATRSREDGKKSPRKVNEATRSKVGKAYRKFGHGPEYDLADLKRKVATLRRGGASNEILKSYPAIHARGGYHDKAEITTARQNFMARGMRKRDQGIKSPRN